MWRPSWAVAGPTWRPPGPLSRRKLEKARMRKSIKKHKKIYDFGFFWPLEAPLEPSWVVLEASWAVLRPSCLGHLVAILGCLGGILGHLGGFGGLPGPSWKPSFGSCQKVSLDIVVFGHSVAPELSRKKTPHTLFQRVRLTTPPGSSSYMCFAIEPASLASE